jgi:hypothetical protein
LTLRTFHSPDFPDIIGIFVRLLVMLLVVLVLLFCANLVGVTFYNDRLRMWAVMTCEAQPGMLVVDVPSWWYGPWAHVGDGFTLSKAGWAGAS